MNKIWSAVLNLLDKYLDKKITETDRIGKNYNGKLLSHDGKEVVLERNDGSVVSLDAITVKFPDTLGLPTKPQRYYGRFTHHLPKKGASSSFI
jgi:hypothetical protein